MTVRASLQIECRQLMDALTKLDDWLGERRGIDPALQAILQGDVAHARAETGLLADAAERPPAIGLLGPIGAQADRIAAALTKPRETRLFGQFEASHVRLPLLSGLLPGPDTRQQTPGRDTLGPGAIIRISHGDPADAAAKATETVVRLMQPADESGKRSLDASIRVSMLSLADVIKILARTFFANVSAAQVPSVTAEIVGTLERAANENVAAATQPGLTSHAIEDIRTYLSARFRRHPMLEALEAAGYWEVFAALAPRATPDGRRRIASLLWSNLADFDALYGVLAKALEQLSYAGDILVPPDAVRESETGWGRAHPHSILAAATLLDLPGDGFEALSVRSRYGQPVAIPRPVLAALAREVRLIVDGDASAVVGGADLLVLPTACPAVLPRRAGDTRLPSDTAPPWLALALLHSKSVYLTEQAAAAHELTGLVLLVDPIQPLSDAFAPVVSQWVAGAQGATPAEREVVETSLFIAVGAAPGTTSAQSGGGRSGAGEGGAIAWPALGTFMRDFASGEDWLQRWSSDLPFDNVFILGEGRQTLSATAPAGGTGSAIATLETMADIDSGLWLRHVRNSAVALDEALNAGDGGCGYLVQSVGALAYDRAKRRQISGHVAGLRRRIVDDMRRFLSTNDTAADSDWRHRAALATQSKLRLAASNQRLGQVIDALATGERSLRWTFERVLAEDARRGRVSAAAATPLTTRLATVEPPSPEAAAWIATRFTRLAMDQWMRGMRSLAAAPATLGLPGFSGTTLSQLVDEVAIAAVRADVSGRMSTAISHMLVSAPGSALLQASRAALLASELIRQHLSVLGFDTPWSALHPRRRGTLGAPLFERAAISDASAIASAPATRFTLQYCSDWCEAFTAMTDDNIAAVRTNRPDDGQFRALDQLLALLGHTVREATL